ncbi:calcium/calmodulin-dependent protein kinase type 2 beta chain [Periconia macrospinosa]|uniref:non-specific serine/threonine protein kinase n=1 Tax=Periconia macrospinosa TaxID=97972 RepID=A0A2V1DIF6_9PLEO|nr:calcium/calmodulin-dependent protein kinase type 2 beta chain [Periconia macrospinosa]
MPEDDKYEVLEKIGHGSFGIIRRVKRRVDGHILCRKEISYSKMSQKEREQLQAELSILKELVHPNIVRYYEREHLKASQDLHLYMEYCGNGDLGRVIQNLKNKNEMADEEFVWSIFSQIVRALYRCHYGQDAPPPGQNVLGLGADAKPVRNREKPMILHRDLKPENIFLDHDNSVKLGDFGLSKILQSHDFASTYVGTPFYMSPEICKAEQYGPHSDIWALGCIIYEMCAKAPPFNAKTHFELIQKIKAGRYPAIPSCYSPDLAQVIAKCLQVAPHNRPDTAQLLNLPIVKLMRKEQEVVSLAQEVKKQRDLLLRKEQEFENKCSITRREINDQLRREWEVKAQLEIERRVKLEVERRVKAEIESLQGQFQAEVKVHVEKALKRYPGRPSKSPKLEPRSSTPTGPEEQSLLFPAEGETTMLDTSTSTLGTASNFTSGTELSSLSLDDSAADDSTITTKPVPRRRSRAPFVRAQTMANPRRASPSSPMDVHMSEPSPAPTSLAPLQLSPRRNQPRNNIFAAAQEGAKKWAGEVPPSPTDSDWHGDFEEDDGIPALPSPTRARCASGNGSMANSDPFKTLATKIPPKPAHQRLASVPSLAPNGTKPRPHSTVPVVTTSPNRPRARPTSTAESTSPVRKTAPKAPEYGLKSKKTEGMRIQALKNNGSTGFQGRTLVELQQARGIPTQTISEDEGKKAPRAGIRSPVKTRTGAMAALPKEPSVWDPSDPDVPSPFMKRNIKMVV